MGIDGLSLSLGTNGVIGVAAPVGPFVPVAAPTDPLGVVTATFTISDVRQVAFLLPVAPDPMAICSLVVNRKTYFAPDITVKGRQLVWNGPRFALGTTLTFEAFGGTATAGHIVLERLITRGGQRTFLLDGLPLGMRAEVVFRGLVYAETSRIFKIQANRLDWRGPTPDDLEPLYVRYAATAQGAAALTQETFGVNPASFRTLGLATTPRNARVYAKGLRYFAPTDFTLGAGGVTLGSVVPFEHGTDITVAGNSASHFFTLPTADATSPERLFNKTNVVLTAPANQIAMAAPPGLSFLDMRGTSYLEGWGYTRSGSVLSWSDIALKAGDDLSLITFFTPRVAAACQFLVVSGLTGYPNIDLGRLASDINKSLVFVSGALTLGGEMYLGDRHLAFPDDRTITWAGPFPLKATDVIAIAFWTDPLVSGALTVASHVVTLAESRHPIAVQLPRSPREFGAVIGALNGQRLVSPRDFVVADDRIHYFQGGVPVHALDEFTFLFH